jgi:multiple antibiotic resistance protein
MEYFTVDLFSISITLFLIMDPMGNIPIFLSILDKIPAERRRTILIRELLLALAIMMVFIFFGQYMMSTLRLRQESISIAGGIILFLISLRMVFPSKPSESAIHMEGDPILVPLAVPLTAGPSLLAVLLLFSTTEGSSLRNLVVASLIAWIATFIVLFCSTFLLKLLKKRGLIAVERLMGMILITLSVQLFLDGLSGYLK